MTFRCAVRLALLVGARLPTSQRIRMVIDVVSAGVARQGQTVVRRPDATHLLRCGTGPRSPSTHHTDPVIEVAGIGTLHRERDPARRRQTCGAGRRAARDHRRHLLAIVLTRCTSVAHSPVHSHGGSNTSDAATSPLASSSRESCLRIRAHLSPGLRPERGVDRREPDGQALGVPTAHVHGNLFAFLNVVIRYLLVALPLQERSARIVSWLALAGMLMPIGILTEVLFGVPPLLVLVGGVSMVGAMVVLGFAVLRAPHSGAVHTN